ncbi:hypothetical protein Bca4012_026066 [Brassica carinata]
MRPPIATAASKYQPETRVTVSEQSDTPPSRAEISPDGKRAACTTLKTRLLQRPSLTLTASQLHHLLKLHQAQTSSRAKVSTSCSPEAEPTKRRKERHEIEEGRKDKNRGRKGEAPAPEHTLTRRPDVGPELKSTLDLERAEERRREVSFFCCRSFHDLVVYTILITGYCRPPCS